MTARPQIPFVLFKEDSERLVDLQKQLKTRTKLNVSVGAVLRLAIRVCPLDKEINLKALELLEDDRRGDWRAGHKKRIYRMSCMVTPKEEEKLEQIFKLISPVLRPRVTKSSLARLVLRLTPSSLIMLQTSREVFFDDLRRRNTEGTEEPKRKAR